MTDRSRALRDTITNGRFYDIDEKTLLHQVQQAFAGELDRLKCAYAVERAPGSPDLQTYNEEPGQTPSEILFEENFDEVNRTLTGLLALRWIHNKEYGKFTCGQSPKVKLTTASFDWLREFYDKHLLSAEDLFTLVLSIIVNDLGKDPNLEEDYQRKTNRPIKGANHDTILLEAANEGMVPSLNMLDQEHRDFVMKGLELGSELNAGQLAQAENVPINLEGLLEMRNHQHAFHLKFMEQILDVAGAAAHYDSRGARAFIEPVFQAFKTVYEVAIDIIDGNCSLRQGYDKVLTKRGNMLYDKGFRRLSVSNRDERALLRLLTMGRTASLEQAELFHNAFEALDQKHRELLVTGLNIDGNNNETAVLPYYMPAMLSECFENTKSLSKPDRERALTSLMRYLARVLQSTDTKEIKSKWLAQLRDQSPEAIPPGATPGIVIERNMMKARDTISSDEFKLNPNLLDELDIPAGQVLQRRRTSHSLQGGMS